MARHHRELTIATAPTRRATTWTNALTDKQALIAHLSDPTLINTTTAEYHAMPKTQRDELKDVGGYVGGHLKGGKRRKDSVHGRSFITLDLDDAPTDLIDRLHAAFTCDWFAHTSSSHTPDNPRWRILIWLSRDVHADEYTAVARRLAEDLNPGLTWIDPTTFEPSRFMYWSAVTLDGEFLTATSKTLDDLNPDTILRRYTDWRDVTTWPGITPDDARRHQLAGTKVEDPRSKPGIIGAFNRAWPIEAAITHFLPEVYKPGTQKNRWTYTGGSSSNGLIIYDGGLHCYSQHATDPASERMLNAFDLVRLHLYGDQDTDPTLPTNKLPSYTAMVDLTLADPATKREANAEAIEKMKEVFQPITTETASSSDTKPEHPQVTTIDTDVDTDEDPLAWTDQLELKKDGSFAETVTNFELILTHDPRYNTISWNEHEGRLEVRDPQTLPWAQLKPGWTEQDSAQLRTTIAENYRGLYSPQKLGDALTATSAQRAFHPVRDYFTTLPPWDGIPRLDYLLVDYLGAPNDDYTHAVTRKTLIAAVRRTFRPGTKFDTVLILVGPQGAGKSTIFAKLAGQWFSDSLSITDMKDKTGAEKLQGILIMEIAELAGMRKMDAETLKGFISRVDDKYRPAYAKTVESHPRQGIIVGSTNARDGFLRDPTGGRRFWTVTITGDGARSVWDLKPTDIDQIWAEAVHYEKKGEKLYLEGAIADVARDHQAAAIEQDDRTGLVADYLDKPLPANWETMPLTVRRHWLAHDVFPSDWNQPSELWTGMEPRATVSKIEIWSECFGHEPEDMKRSDSYEISSILTSIGGWEDTGERARLDIYGRQRIHRRASADVRGK